MMSDDEPYPRQMGSKSSHSLKLQQHLYAQLQAQSEFCDVSLDIGGSEMKAHWCVLVSCPYFQSLYDSGMKEQQAGKVKICVGKTVALRAAITFLYLGTLEISYESVQDILEVADYLQIEDLKQACTDYLSSVDITVDNCISLILLSSLYDLDIDGKVLDFFRGHLPEVMEQPETLTLTSESIIVVLTDKSLNYVALEDFFKFIVKWVEHDREPREKYFAEMFCAWDLRKMSRDFLEKTVELCPLVSGSSACVMHVLNMKMKVMKERYTFPIDVKCEVEEDELFFRLSAFHPYEMRNHLEGADWVSLQWIEQCVQLERATEVDRHTTQILSEVTPVLENLKLTTYTEGGVPRRKWTLSADFQKRNASTLESKVGMGFQCNMSKAQGREMVSSLFTSLLDNFTVTSKGGGRDPAVKNIYLIPMFIDSEDERVIEKPKPSNEDYKKDFVPDMVVEHIENFEIRREVLNVSVKSGHYVTERYLSRLKYQLLPVLMRQQFALGLLICAGEAFLCRFTVTDTGDITCRRRFYYFGNDTLRQSVSQMCEDVVYYSKY